MSFLKLMMPVTQTRVRVTLRGATRSVTTFHAPANQDTMDARVIQVHGIIIRAIESGLLLFILCILT